MRWMVRGAGGNHQVEVERSADGFTVTIDGRRQDVDLICLDGSMASLRFSDDGRSFQVAYHRGRDRQWRVAVREREFDLAVLTPLEAVDQAEAATARGPSRLLAPIPGKVVAVKVATGDQVAPGQPLVVLEAMKMENELLAEGEGRVAAIHVEPGDTVENGSVLVELE